MAAAALSCETGESEGKAGVQGLVQVQVRALARHPLSAWRGSTQLYRDGLPELHPARGKGEIGRLVAALSCG